MSVQAMAWVFDNSPAKGGDRLVLLAVANYARTDGSGSWPAVETLASDARLSRSQVQRCLRRLEAAGQITRTGESSKGTNVYAVVMGGPQTAAPAEEAEGPHGRGPGGPQMRRGGAAPARPEPPEVQPPIEPPIESARESTGLVLGGSRRTWKVDGKTVSDDEYERSRQILTRWNDVTGQRLASTDWLAKIVMRLREHPELGYDDHVEVILANLNHPWWSGPPTPSVIYGNGAQFERAMMTQAHGTTAGGDAALAVALDEQRRMEAGR